jgi:LPXTG-motif cell wall-anchored protein
VTTTGAAQEGASGSDELAATGSDSSIPLLGGIGLFCAGAILVIMRLRRTAQSRR